MKYQSLRSYTCVLLSLLAVTAGVSGSSRDGVRTIATTQHDNHENHDYNDYMESTLRRLQEAKQQQQPLVTDRRGRTKSCNIDGSNSCASSFYYYKEFEHGATFHQAHAAIGSAPDLEGCVLAPVYSYDDLVEISDTIPPCKAAYTAAYKDPLEVFKEARACVLNGQYPYNCDFEPLGDTLQSLWGSPEGSSSAGGFGACSLEDWFGDDFTNGDVWCPSLRENWTNFGSSEAIPSEAWRAGDSSYCGNGPLENAAAAFATDYSTGVPTAVLKALNSGEYLPGAVYKCCKETVAAACFGN